MERAGSAAPAAQGFVSRHLNEYRVASYLLVLYAVGHTLGAVVETPAFGPESDATVTLMKSVRLQTEGASCTWYGFYRGFGIYVTIFFVVTAMMTWFIGGMGPRDRAVVAPLTWSLFFAYAASIVVDVAYFFTTPTLFSCAVTAALGVACVRARRLRPTATLAAEPRHAHDVGAPG